MENIFRVFLFYFVNFRGISMLWPRVIWLFSNVEFDDKLCSIVLGSYEALLECCESESKCLTRIYLVALPLIDNLLNHLLHQPMNLLRYTRFSLINLVMSINLTFLWYFKVNINKRRQINYPPHLVVLMEIINIIQNELKRKCQDCHYKLKIN